MSAIKRVGMERSLLFGTVRSFVQLVAVGYVLDFILGANHPAWVLLMAAVMVVIAALDGTRRIEQKFKRAFLVVLASIGVAMAVSMATALLLVIRVKPWWQPQYLIPLAGMMTANALNAASLVVNQMTSEVRHRSGEIEVALSLGATPAKATHRAVRAATHAAMLPAINMMMIVGIVQIPGMMSGQIIAGTEPLDAVMYQLIVIYMIAAATTVSSILASVLTSSRLFSDRQQLLHV